MAPMAGAAFAAPIAASTFAIAPVVSAGVSSSFFSTAGAFLAKQFTIGNILSGVGLIAGAGASSAAVAAQVAAAEFQARVASEQAQREIDIAAAAAEDFDVETKALQKKRLAILGAQGVRVDTGSPLLVAADIEKEAKLSRNRIIAGGQTTARRKSQEAQLAILRGRGAARAGSIRTGAALLKTAGKFFT